MITIFVRLQFCLSRTPSQLFNCNVRAEKEGQGKFSHNLQQLVMIGCTGRNVMWCEAIPALVGNNRAHIGGLDVS